MSEADQLKIMQAQVRAVDFMLEKVTGMKFKDSAAAQPADGLQLRRGFRGERCSHCHARPGEPAFNRGHACSIEIFDELVHVEPFNLMIACDPVADATSI